jgi:LysM repeat protein
MQIKRRKTHRAITQTSHNRELAKKNAILLLTLVSNIIVLLLKLVAAILWLLKFTLGTVVRLIIRYIILPFYRIQKHVLLKLKRLSTYTHEQFGNNFSRNIIIYGGLIILSMFVATSNIKARELRPEEIGRNSSLYTLLIEQGDYDIIIEESLIAEDNARAVPTEAPERALAELGVEHATRPIGELGDEFDQTLVTTSGSALIKPDLTATDITPKLRDSIITYVVQEGDTISEVAELFDVSTNTILWENKIGPRDFIKPGQELVILPVTGVTHTITRGDTLNAISARYRAKSEDILEINKLADASELVVGKKVVVPDGIPPAPVRPTYSPPSGLANLGSIFKPAQPIAGKFNWPTTRRRITQYFRGWRHSGLDIGAPSGQPIYAANDGLVTVSGWSSGGYGRYIIIDHGNGLSTLYAHNTQNAVKVGDRVSKGAVIGTVGSTGRSTGPHVHFEVRAGGNRVNPLDYL